MRQLTTLLPALLLVLAAPAQAATRAEVDPSALSCIDRVNMPEIQNVMETKWSPDGHTLAVVWFSQLPSRRQASGYIEQELVDALDVSTGRLVPIGVGDEPDWSGDGSLLSYWGPNAGDLRITKGSLVVARLTPTLPRVKWVGDALVFIEKNELREWSRGEVRTLAKIAAPFVPSYPRDDVYFSADGSRFTMTRYSQDSTLERYLGTTRTGQVSAMNDTPGARLVEWAPSGNVLLIRYLDRIELRDLDGARRTVSLAGSPGIVHTWLPDGKAAVLGTVSPTIPAGNVFDNFSVWNAQYGTKAATLVTLPNLLGERVFSPEGKFFAGVSRTGPHTTRLEVYRCSSTQATPPADPEMAARLAKIEASPNRLVRPTSGEITQFLTASHTGIDVAAPFGDIITADDDGTVTAVEWVAVGGNRVCVTHALALESCWYHTAAPLVTVGQRVVRGQPVALIGMTGVTTGPHTHWEIKQGGRFVDPLTR
jgi:murein DD-endopeptidase MepM/ murein hydrolase activator NlpD